MAYAPIALTIPQYEDQANWWLKAYDQGTTTPLSMATDAAAGTLLVKCEIDSAGFPITAGSARFIPFINGDYDLWAFPTSAEADANDTTSAIQFADNLNTDPQSSAATVGSYTVANKAAAVLLTPVSGKSLYVESTDGGLFKAKTGAAPGTYSDDLASYCGVTFIPTGGDGSVAWVRNYDGEINTKWFGAVGDGATDDTVAIQAAIDYFSAGQGSVYLSNGTYLVTSTITIAQDRVHLWGSGQFSTVIDFEPTANDVCLLVDAGTTAIYQGSIKNIGFYSNDVTYDKTCIKLMDGSGYQVDRVGTMFPHVTGGTESIFLRIEGREHGQISNIYAKADTPISIGVIASPHTPSGISIDNHNFHNMSLLSNGSQIVKIDTGVLLTQVSFTGIQSWVGGDYGLYWLDTTSAGVSNGLVLDNVRYESGTDITAYLVYIAHNTTLQGLIIKSGQGGDRKGFYLRNVDNVTFDTFYFTGALEALNVDSTVTGIQGRNCFWQASSTATISGQRLISASPPNPNTGALPPNFTYDIDKNTDETSTVGTIIIGEESTLADNTAVALPASKSFIFGNDSGNASAQFVSKGTVGGVDEISDWATLYSSTMNNAATANVYYDTGLYYLQNRRGSTLTFTVTIIGS